MDLNACCLVLASGTLTQVFLPLLPFASTLCDFCSGVHLPIFILVADIACEALAEEGRITCHSNMVLCSLVGSLQIHFH
jgi:hypothetical protein